MRAEDVILLQVWGSKRWMLYNAPTKLPYTEARNAWTSVAF